MIDAPQIRYNQEKFYVMPIKHLCCTLASFLNSALGFSPTLFLGLPRSYILMNAQKISFSFAKVRQVGQV